MRPDPGRYRQMPIACPATRGSLCLYECYPPASIRSPAGDKFRLPDRRQQSPRVSRGGSPRSPIPSTSTASLRERRATETDEKVGVSCVVSIHPQGGASSTANYKLTRAGVESFPLHAPAGNRSSFRGWHRTTVPRVSKRLPKNRLIHKPSEADVIDQPQSQEIRPEIGPPGAHERQWDAGHRHAPHHHPDIHQHME